MKLMTPSPLPSKSRSSHPAKDSRSRVLTPLNDEQLAAALKEHGPLIKALLKEQYLALTDDDLRYAEGEELELLEHLERKTGRDRAEFWYLILQHSSSHRH